MSQVDGNVPHHPLADMSQLTCFTFYVRGQADCFLEYEALVQVPCVVFFFFFFLEVLGNGLTIVIDSSTDGNEATS